MVISKARECEADRIVRVYGSLGVCHASKGLGANAGPVHGSSPQGVRFHFIESAIQVCNWIRLRRGGFSRRALGRTGGRERHE
jgi:hypothetical protein